MNQNLQAQARHDPLAGAIGRITGAGDACSQSVGMAAEQAMTDGISARVVLTSVEVRANRNFADALMHVMSGKRITRLGWNGPGQHVEMLHPSAGNRLSAPFLALRNTRGQLVPWLPSQGDLFADDWALLP